MKHWLLEQEPPLHTPPEQGFPFTAFVQLEVLVPGEQSWHLFAGFSWLLL
jgi:hypothetical protein